MCPPCADFGELWAQLEQALLERRHGSGSPSYTQVGCYIVYICSPFASMVLLGPHINNDVEHHKIVSCLDE